MSKMLITHWIRRIPLTQIENQSQRLTIITPLKELSELVGKHQASHEILHIGLTESGS